MQNVEHPLDTFLQLHIRAFCPRLQVLLKLCPAKLKLFQRQQTLKIEFLRSKDLMKQPSSVAASDLKKLKALLLKEYNLDWHSLLAERRHH